MVFVQSFGRFAADETGAVTVDWVVLTAGIVGLGLVVIGTASGGLTKAAVNTSEDIVATQIEASNLGQPD